MWQASEQPSLCSPIRSLADSATAPLPVSACANRGSSADHSSALQRSSCWGSATEVGVVLIAWVVAQLGFNAALAALVATLPDQAGPRERGRLSGLIGMTLPIGLVAAAFFAQMFETALQMAVVPGGIVGTAIAIAFAFTFRDRVLTEKPAPLNLKEILGSFYFNPQGLPGGAGGVGLGHQIPGLRGLLRRPSLPALLLHGPPPRRRNAGHQPGVPSNLGQLGRHCGHQPCRRLDQRPPWQAQEHGHHLRLIMMGGLVVIATSTNTSQVLVGQGILAWASASSAPWT